MPHRARDQAQDRLARSRYEQARALVVSGLAGRRWEILDLLQESESLRGRPRRGGYYGRRRASDLPARWQLRSEAVAALLQTDARLAWSVTLFGEAQPGPLPDARLLRWPGGIRRKTTRLCCWTCATAGSRALAPSPVRRRCACAGPVGRRLASFDPAGGRSRCGPLPEGRKLNTLDWPDLSDADGPARTAPDFLMSSEMAFSPDGRYLTVVARCRSVRYLVLWDLQETAIPQTLARLGNDADQGSTQFLPDRNEVLYPSGNQTLSSWRLPTGEPSDDIRLPLPLAGKPAVDAAGRRLACPCRAPGIQRGNDRDLGHRAAEGVVADRGRFRPLGRSGGL